MRFAIAEAKAKSQLLIIPPLHAPTLQPGWLLSGSPLPPSSDIVPFSSHLSLPFFKAQLKGLLLQEVLLDSLPLLPAPFAYSSWLDPSSEPKLSIFTHLPFFFLIYFLICL